MAVLDGRTMRTYGNWRKPSSRGVLGLGDAGTVLLFVGVLAVIVAIATVGVLRALVVALVFVVVLGGLLITDRHGRSVLTRITDRAGWTLTRAAGAHLYHSGPLSRIPGGRYQLPGLLAATTLSQWLDSYGRPFAIIETPSTHDFAVIIAVEPDGASLVDPEQIDAWVANWGGWIAMLGGEPGVVAASVTIEASPDTGARLRREVEVRTDPNAHPVAQAILVEAVETYPSASPIIRTWVSLTFSAAARPGGRRRTVEEMGRDLATRLPGLTFSLASTGAGAAHPLSKQEVCEVVRTAYDPTAGRLLESARARGEDVELSWSDVGPAGAHTGFDHYRHDGAVSTSWTMTDPPRGAVSAEVLSGLLAQHKDVDRKRVSVLYRPEESGRAAAIVESDKRKAEFRVSSMTKPSARALAESRAATQSAEEEAMGAGLVNFGLVVTATVADPERLPEARAAVDSLSTSARLLLRPAFGAQDSTFVAGLPLGTVIARHLRIPTEIRSSL